jgi:hypothetical protein
MQQGVKSMCVRMWLASREKKKEEEEGASP